VCKKDRLRDGALRGRKDIYSGAFELSEGRMKVSYLALITLLASAAQSGFALQADTPELISVRDKIVAIYQSSIDALSRGDADAAMQLDTDDWTSLVVGQPPRSKQELAPFIRRDIATMKPPAAWKVVWLPDYEHNGTTTGIQLYDLKVNGKAATVLCLVGTTHEESIGSQKHSVWTGSHVRDSWTQTAAGWKRSKHEKLTINERMVDGKPTNRN
jgi:ketosteroid isomerase-like protein